MTRSRAYHHFLAVLLLAAATIGTPAPLAAACYVDYKAKQDDPLRLHYGVIEVSEEDCADRNATIRDVADRISGDGWQLLAIVSTFDESGLEEREESAGEYYLRY